MTTIPEIISQAANTTTLTLETMMAAIDKLKERPPIFPEGHPFHGVFEVKECAALKGTQVVVISNGKAHYWPDIFDLKEYKVLRLHDREPENEVFKMEYEPLDPSTMRIHPRM